MEKRLQIFFLCVFLSISSIAFSTHIVGGTLNYVYNGGSSYTVTLKLFRDCGEGTAAFPSSVTINVLGYNGATFSPSRDITINIATVTLVPPTLPICAISPDQTPCVEQAIYSKTVTNLPPNPGGYHLTYQLCCRNGSISNISNPGSAGASFYAYIPGTSGFWGENFTLPDGTTVDTGPTAWSIAAGTTAPTAASVTSTFGYNSNTSRFEITGANNAQLTWTSQVIPISSCPSVNLSVDLFESGDLDPNDSIFVYYRLNGGPLTLFSTNGFIRDDFGSAVASKTGIAGSTVQIVIRVRFDGSSAPGYYDYYNYYTPSEQYQFDNVLVSCNNFAPNNNPVFTLFPPIFICVGQPFTFDHSATDANGDSLVYSLYTPYDVGGGFGGGGWGGSGGSTYPTFSGNTAIFTPVVWQPGYSATNPLGGAPLNLNASTGLLTGTPPMLGQFVVGVVVKEYRNGVYISETLRDFQFNVVNCPPLPPAVAGNDIAVNQGCSNNITASGYTPSTVTWNSVFPGVLGAYNNYLNSTSGTLTPTATAPIGAPPYVDYQICGEAASCQTVYVCDTVRVSFNPPLSVTIAPQNPVLCVGQTSTTLTATGSGGTPPYAYLWNNQNPSQSILVGNGTYTVQLLDASGCPAASAQVTVTSYSVAVSANAGLDQTACKQNPIRTLTGAVAGANGGIWSGGGGVFSPNNTTLSATYSPAPAELTAGFVDLTLTTTGSGTCPAASDVVRIDYVDFTGTVSFTQTPISCFGGNDGSATVNIAGGMSPYSYSWNTSPAQSAATASNLSIGTYNVTITNSMGCTSTNPVTISQPTPLSLASSITNVSCAGGNNGSISISPSGGTGPYTYLWSPSNQTTASISSQPAGTYTVTVTDSRSCTKILPYSINEPSPIIISLAPIPVSCFGGTNGAANSTVSGGTSPYTYNWSPGGATSPNAAGLQAGTFTLTITDNNGCLQSNSVNITQPNALLLTTAVTNVTCNGSNNGTATASASGGTPGYTYLWQPGVLTSAGISNLSSGTYTLTVTDLNGCTETDFATITEPAPLTINFVNQVNVSCFGGSDGSVTANPSGGTPNYTYLWAGGATTTSKTNLSAGTGTVTVTDSRGCVATNSVVITQPTLLTASTTSTDETCGSLNNGTATAIPSGGTSGYTYLWQPGLQTTGTAPNLSAGTQTLTVTDSKECVATANATVTEPAPLVISFTAQTNVSCFAGNNGAVAANPSGGTSAYTYLWTPGGATTATITGLSAGTYSVTITDSKGCFTTNSVVITQPSAPLIPGITVTNETCNSLNNGTATAAPAGGTPGYTYLWQPSAITTLSINNLSSGTYTLTVTDSKGCISTTNAVITEPPPTVISFTNQINVSCFGGNDGSVAATASGGTPNYTYLWSNGATTSQISNLTSQIYSVTITDAKGCIAANSVTITQPSAPLAVSASSLPASCFGSANGSVSSSATNGTGPYTYSWMPGSITTQNISNLAAGTYYVTATDSKGCISTNSVAITQPDQIILLVSSVNSDCGQPNGQTTVSVSGGNAPYIYLWSPSGGTDATATGLVTGAYTVLVTDFAGCTASQFGNVNENSAPVASISSVVNLSCNGSANGSANAGVSGGIGPFTYSWLPTGGTGSIATGLTAGSYTVTVTGSNGCKSLATTSPAITQPPPILITVTKNTVSCFGDNDGTASGTASGGTPGYTYLWSNGGTSSQISNLTSQAYTLQVTDTNSCVKTEPFIITQPAALSVSLSFTPGLCFGGADGTVSANAAGGTAPYNYNWMPGNFNGPALSNLSAGTYTVTVTDAKGCILTDSITVTQPTPITLVTDSINSNCSLANGQASVLASGGVGSFSYQWSPSGGTNATATNLIQGTYEVTVTDGNGCTSTSGTTINDNPSPVATVFSTTNVSCNAGANGTATVSVSGGNGPFTYSWMPSGNTNSIATGLLAGTHTVTVTDANLCQSLPAISPEITQPYPILITVTKTNITCFGDNDGSASAIAAGGIPGYAYQWMPGGSTGTSITNLPANTYTIQVTDTNSCIQTLPVVITEPAQLTVVFSPVTNVSCYGLSDGTATAAVSGGTAGYTYNWMPSGGNGPAGNGLSEGTYTVTITDLNGCITSNAIAITQPNQALSATNTASNITCFGASDGTIGISPAGGTSAYSYLWNPAVSTNDTTSGLAPGNYTIVVTDNNSCQTNLAISITEPPEITGSLVSVNPSCGLSNGAISSQLSGGVLPYTYLWSYTASTTSAITGLGTGTYNLLVTDASGCTKSLTVTLTIAPNPSIGISSVNNVSCFGGNDGSATISITQGTAPYVLNWTPSGGNSLTASALSIGTYTVSITDAVGCQTIDSIIIAEPTPVDVNISSITDVLCNGGNTGSISVAATGGTGPSYTYLWTPSGSTSSTAIGLTIGTYTVNVMDQNNCIKAISAAITEPTVLTSTVDTIIHATCYDGNGSAIVLASGGVIPYNYTWTAPATAQTGGEANNLSAASYTVTITDTNGCFTNINVIVKQPLQIITSTGENDTLCLGQTGSVSATAVGGDGNYYYTWQPTGAITSGTLPITPTSNTTYTVVAFDQNGCAGTPETVTAIVYNLTAANVEVMGATPICPGQSTYVSVETTGITGPLTYQWNNNLGNDPAGYLVTPAQPTTYVVTVSNMCGLSVSDSVEILFNPQPTMDLSSFPDALCVPGIFYFNDNSVTGNPDDPITMWEWNFGDGTTSTEEDPAHSYTEPGTYSVTLTVSTSGGCSSNNTVAPTTITAHPTPTAAFSVSSTSLDIPFDVLTLNNQSVGASSYYWEFGDAGTSTQFNPQYVYTSVGIFQVQLIAVSQFGCADTAFAEVTTNADVIFPNAFTPNPNGSQGGIYDLNNLSNDIFFPYSSGVIEFKIEIFNRWGEEIFESLDIKQGWDGYYRGQICQQDVYVWKAYVKLNNGKIFHKNGDVTLLRY